MEESSVWQDTVMELLVKYVLGVIQIEKKVLKQLRLNIYYE